jgi:hypothetical protein
VTGWEAQIAAASLLTPPIEALKIHARLKNSVSSARAEKEFHDALMKRLVIAPQCNSLGRIISILVPLDLGHWV